MPQAPTDLRTGDLVASEKDGRGFMMGAGDNASTAKQKQETTPVEVVRSAGEPAAHEHNWRGVAHVDFCHFYTWTYLCYCGATASSRTERDLAGDPWSAVWMDDEGTDEPCVRCGELLNGAKPEHRVEIIEAGPSTAATTNAERSSPKRGVA